MSRSLVVGAIALVSVALMTAGCEENIAGRAEYDAPFSVYGLLTPDRDTQFVWIYPIEEFPTLGSPEALEGVTVTSTDLETGDVTLWEDTVLVQENGQHEYLYRAPFRAAFDRRYRLEVTREGDSEPTWADVRIPPRSDVQLVNAGRDRVVIDVLGSDIQAMKSSVEYLVRIATVPDTSYRRHYWGTEEKIPGGWRLNIRLNVDRYWVEAWYVRDMPVTYPRCPIQPGLKLLETRLHVLVGDTAWAPPGPAFDPYILSQPGTLQNVRNGKGFIGGGYRIDRVIDVPRDAVEAACFIYCSSPWECHEPPLPY